MHSVFTVPLLNTCSVAGVIVISRLSCVEMNLWSSSFTCQRAARLLLHTSHQRHGRHHRRRFILTNVISAHFPWTRICRIWKLGKKKKTEVQVFRIYGMFSLALNWWCSMNTGQRNPVEEVLVETHDHLVRGKLRCPGTWLGKSTDTRSTCRNAGGFWLFVEMLRRGKMNGACGIEPQIKLFEVDKVPEEKFKIKHSDRK